MPWRRQGESINAELKFSTSKITNMKDIAVVYLKPKKEIFISNIINTNNFLDALSKYVRVKTIVTNLEEVGFQRLKDSDIDYLLVDIKNFGVMQFILREKLQLNIPFIVILHAVYPWAGSLVRTIPLIRKEDIIIAPSEYARNSFLRISNRFNIQVINLFLDVKYIQDNISYDLKEHNIKLITFMGRLVEEKGIEALIRSMPEIIARAGNAHLNIIGPLSGGGIKDKPKSKYVKKLEGTVRQLKLTKRVHFKGVQLGLDKYRLLSKSNIFVSPTTALGEAFPVANIEALACRVPVITTNWGGNKELVRDGKNGFLIDVNYGQDKKPKINTEQLISAIVKTLKNKQLEAKMRKNALNSARRYDYRRVLPRLVRLLKKRPRGRPRERWNLIKDKTAADFRGSFNKDFFFFINFDSHFRKKTYAALYRDVLLAPYSQRERPLRATKRMLRHKSRDLAIVKRLRRNLEDFLLLRSN